jgi:hypothetical protein
MLLGFAGAWILGQHQLDRVGSFRTAFLLQLVNPIGHSFYHFTRGLRGRGSLRRGLLLTHSLVLLDDFYSFLFWHFDQLVFVSIR